MHKNKKKSSQTNEPSSNKLKKGHGRRPYTWGELEVRGSKRELERFMTMAASPQSERKQDLDFNNFLPIPDDVLKAGEPQIGDWCHANWEAERGLLWSELTRFVDGTIIREGRLYYTFVADNRCVEFFRNVALHWPKLAFGLIITAPTLKLPLYYTFEIQDDEFACWSFSAEFPKPGEMEKHLKD